MTEPTVSVVTGGAGFIGSHMVDLLLGLGGEVRVIDDLSGGREANLAAHANEPRLAVDRRDIRDVEAGDPVFADARQVFHFAGIGDIVPSIREPKQYMSVNVQGTVAALEGARGAGVAKFVYAASSSCYGVAETPTREDHAIDPQYPYALSKYMGEQAVFHWHRVYRLPVNSIRIFNAYGPRVRTTGAYGAVLGVFLRQKLARRPYTVVGDGSQRRDFVHVTDVAEAFRRAAETDIVGEVFNLGAGDPQSIDRLVELLGGERVHIAKRPGEPDCTWADTSKIRSLLGWRPVVSFEDGIAEMVGRIDDWRDAPLWTAETIADATRDWFEALAE